MHLFISIYTFIIIYTFIVKLKIVILRIKVKKYFIFSFKPEINQLFAQNEYFSNTIFLQNILPCLEGAGAGWECEGGDEEGDAEGVDEPVIM